MKWINHQLTTLAIFYTASGNPIQSLIASVSSNLPDLIKLGPGRLIFRKHRGTSHNPLFWFAVLPLVYLFLRNFPGFYVLSIPYLPGPEPLFLAISAGIFLHLLADSLSGSGIPLWGNKRIALKVFKTFTFSEFAVVFLSFYPVVWRDFFSFNMKDLIPRHTAFTKTQRGVPYLTTEEVRTLAERAETGKNDQRNALLIPLLFQTGLRLSKALSLTPSRIGSIEGKPVPSILGKGGKPRIVACPERLADKLKSYSHEKKIGPDDRFFPINRSRAWQIIKEASKRAGVPRKNYPRLLRNSDAIERLRQTGNPKGLQLHLEHSSTMMTMRYLSTLTQEGAVRINSGGSF